MAYAPVVGDCILVKPHRGNLGYRIEQRNGVRKNAARWALEARLGRELGAGMVPDHLCRVRNCINTDHLEEVTKGENTRRAAQRYPPTCPQGHTDFKVRDRGQGQRECRTCNKAHIAKWKRESRKKRTACAETVYGRNGAHPCTYRATAEAKMPNETLWTPLCGTHANADRWANYVDMQWRDFAC